MSALTSLLVRDQVVPVRKIEAAIQRQVISGGDLDTVLLEMGVVKENVLNAYRAVLVNHLAATRNEIEDAPREAIKWVPREVAMQYQLIPLKLEEREVVVAVAEPLSENDHRQLSFLLGRELVYRIATRARIMMALAHHYQVELETRLVRLREKLRKQDAGPVPYVAPPEETRVDPARLAVAGAFESEAADGAQFFAPGRGLSQDAHSIEVPLDDEIPPADSLPADEMPASRIPARDTERAQADRAPGRSDGADAAGAFGRAGFRHETTDQWTPTVAPAGEPPAVVTTRTEVVQTRGSSPPQAAANRASEHTRPTLHPFVRKHRGPLTAERAAQYLADAEDRDEVVAIFFAFARQFFDAAALFVLQQGKAVGVEEVRDSSARDIAHVAVNLSESSLFQATVQAVQPTIGTVGQGDHGPWVARALGRSPQTTAVVAPVRIRKRVVLLFYADRDGDTFNISDIPELVAFVPRVSAAFERLILRRKFAGYKKNDAVEKDPGLRAAAKRMREGLAPEGGPSPKGQGPDIRQARAQDDARGQSPAERIPAARGAAPSSAGTSGSAASGSPGWVSGYAAPSPAAKDAPPAPSRPRPAAPVTGVPVGGGVPIEVPPPEPGTETVGAFRAPVEAVAVRPSVRVGEIVAAPPAKNEVNESGTKDADTSADRASDWAAPAHHIAGTSVDTSSADSEATNAGEQRGDEQVGDEQVGDEQGLPPSAQASAGFRAPSTAPTDDIEGIGETADWPAEDSSPPSHSDDARLFGVPRTAPPPPMPALEEFRLDLSAPRAPQESLGVGAEETDSSASTDPRETEQARDAHDAKSLPAEASTPAATEAAEPTAQGSHGRDPRAEDGPSESHTDVVDTAAIARRTMPPSAGSTSTSSNAPDSGATELPEGVTVIVDMGENIEQLVSQLERCSPEEDEEAIAALLKVGEAALPVLVRRFPGPLWFDRHEKHHRLPRGRDISAIARAIASFGDRAIPYVASLLTGHSVDARFYATLLSTEVPSLDLIHPLGERLFDVDGGTRALALDVLRRYPAFTKPMAEMFKSLRVQALRERDDPNRRRLAARALGELRDGRSVETLLRLLTVRDATLRDLAHQALAHITKQDFGDQPRKWQPWYERWGQCHRVEWLIEALVHPDEGVRASAASELKQTTQEYFGYHPASPKRDREIAQRKYRKWWEDEGAARFGARPGSTQANAG